MASSNIRVFIRVRPSAKPSKGFSIDPEKAGLAFEVEKSPSDGQVNNSRTQFKYSFDGILPMQAAQEDVFNIVAKPVIEDVLQGINGTIFAYGQTGSGKTYTITGGAERYSDRGLIPRSIAHLFEAFKQNPACKFRLYISYLEIYNNDGYDLLTREDGATKLEELPKVVLREDEEGNIKLRNLSVNIAQKAEDALNLLFLGDTNRVVAETPMNDASTRSHCMFIMWVESTRPDSDTVRRAKLHLVDLAGSERIGKSGVEGKLQREATSINLSLHYLEQVIVALHERAQGRRQHVPYRNSILTSVLRDSLGGNCRTIMVGTVAVEDSNIDESISTCRFAQRVACIKNHALVNEELDPALLIRRLKREVAELKDELTLLSGGDEEGELGDEGREECRRLVSAYLEDTDLDAPLVCGSVKRFRECFQILRQVYWQRQADGMIEGGGCAKSSTAPVPSGGGAPIVGAVPGSLEAIVIELRQQVAQRDQEIGLLLGSLHRHAKGKDPQTIAKDGPVFIKGTKHQQQLPQLGEPPNGPAETFVGASPEIARMGQQPAPVDPTALLLDRNKAFEVFRKSMRRTETLEEGKEAMKKLVADAQALGEAANAARSAINGRKVRMEKLRMDRALESNPHNPNGVGAPPPDPPEVIALLKEIEEQKRVYHQATERLKQVKAEIDNYKQAADQNKQRLQRDFEAWYRSLQASNEGATVALAEDPRQAITTATLAWSA